VNGPAGSQPAPLTEPPGTHAVGDGSLPGDRPVVFRPGTPKVNAHAHKGRPSERVYQQTAASLERNADKDAAGGEHRVVLEKSFVPGGPVRDLFRPVHALFNVSVAFSTGCWLGLAAVGGGRADQEAGRQRWANRPDQERAEIRPEVRVRGATDERTLAPTMDCGREARELEGRVLPRL
jgi:hypothetical protein